MLKNWSTVKEIRRLSLENTHRRNNKIIKFLILYVSLTVIILALYIHIIFFFLVSVLTPLWILAMGRFVKSSATSIPYGKLILWLSLSLASYILGAMLRRKSEKVADAILNWLSKPFLLFASILFVSLGLYINFFMFLVLDGSSLLGIATYPCLTYCVGYVLPWALRQQTQYTKTIATESAIPNCILALVIVQYVLDQPASDISTIAPIWVLIFSPVPFIIEYLIKQLQVVAQEKCAKRKEIKNRHFSIVASTSLLNVTHTTQLESSSFVSQRNNNTPNNNNNTANGSVNITSDTSNQPPANSINIQASASNKITTL